MIRCRSPVHIHVDDATPVHVHVQKKKLEGISVSVHYVDKILHQLQGAAKKVIPCRIFQIFKQPLRIF